MPPRPSRREARIARAAEREAANQEKSARLAAQVEIPDRTPRAGADPNSIYQMSVEWTLDWADRDGSWSTGTGRDWSGEQWNEHVVPKLTEWVKLTWAEIDKFSSDSGHKMHHNMDTDAIIEEAQLRLIDIERHEDIIFRFRCGNLKRLWGHRVLNRFHVIWFDQKHEIYPTDPD